MNTEGKLGFKSCCSVYSEKEKKMTASSKSKPNTSRFELLLDALLLCSPHGEEFSPNFYETAPHLQVSQFSFHLHSLLTMWLILHFMLLYLNLLTVAASPHIWKVSLQNAVGNVLWETYSVWMIFHRFHMWMACPLCVLQHNSTLERVSQMQTVL